ncbi:MAG: hypothetical protein AAB614_01995 [Patescibacteria group bacterium]
MDFLLFNKIISSLTFIGSLSVVAFLSIYLIKEKLNEKILKRVLIGILIFFATVISLKSYLQYVAWKADAFARYFLPPHTDIAYFFQYVFFHFLAERLIAFIFGLFILMLFLLIERFYKKDVISRNDKYIFFIFSILVGWPNFLIYLGVIFFLSFIYMIVVAIIKKDFKQVISLTYFWPISAFLTLLFGEYLAKMLNLYMLTI